MRLLRQLFGVALMILTIGVPASSQPLEKFLDDLQSSDKALKFGAIGYLYGLRDGVGEMQDFYTSLNLSARSFYCVPEAVKVSHFGIADLLREEAIAYPDTRDQDTMVVFLRAMSRKYPCSVTSN